MTLAAVLQACAWVLLKPRASKPVAKCNFMEAGLVTRADDPEHKQKGICSLTEEAIQLAPLLVHMGAWGRRHLAVSAELSIRARLLEEDGPPLWDECMDELRETHLRVRRRRSGATVAERLQAAYEAACRKSPRA
jgi:hypothetical protein